MAIKHDKKANKIWERLLASLPYTGALDNIKELFKIDMRILQRGWGAADVTLSEIEDHLVEIEKWSAEGDMVKPLEQFQLLKEHFAK